VADQHQPPEAKTDLFMATTTNLEEPGHDRLREREVVTEFTSPKKSYSADSRYST
jgi:hypothetical protein